MIYVCVPCHNEAATVGVLLWKVRRVFEEFPREYHLVVADDGSDDATADVLAPYAKVLPLTILRADRRAGYAATVERLLRHALEQTDRPKRDAVILLHADFTHDADTIPEMVRRIESGADFVVAEGTITGSRSGPIAGCAGGPRCSSAGPSPCPRCATSSRASWPSGWCRSGTRSSRPATACSPPRAGPPTPS